MEVSSSCKKTLQKQVTIQKIQYARDWPKKATCFGQNFMISIENIDYGYNLLFLTWLTDGKVTI